VNRDLLRSDIARLSELADLRAKAKTKLSRDIRRWRRDVFSQVDTLAWSFAIGAWWATGQRAPAERLRDSVIGAANAIWLTGRVIMRRDRSAGDMADSTASAVGH
jgi:hypothetical protein